MVVSYLKLWKMLLDKRMKKKDLMVVADISTATVAKMSKDQVVSIEVMGRICLALKCDIGDVMEIILPPDEDNGGNITAIFSEAENDEKQNTN